MNELTLKEFSDLLYDKLFGLKVEILLQNPNTKSKFPCITIGTPLERVLKTKNAFPLLKHFNVNIKCWNAKQRACMEMASIVDEKLREYNLIRTNTSDIVFDDITKKYWIQLTYEVRWEALTNSFIFIK